MPVESLLMAAERLSRDGSLVVTYADSSFLGKVLNWLIAVDRAGVHNALVVALDESLHNFIHQRGFASVLVPTGTTLNEIRLTRLRVCQVLLRSGISVIQSDADAVWLRDPRPEFFANDSAAMVASQGVYWPPKAHAKWGFVLCTGLFSVRSEAATNVLLERWIDDFHETGSDQESLNRLLLSDGVTWEMNSVTSETRLFRNRSFQTFDAPVSGICTSASLSLCLLPHMLFQRVPVEAPSPYVAHYLPDLADLPDTQALTDTGSWFLADGWKNIDFDAGSLDRITISRAAERADWTDPQIRFPLRRT